ncbi:MAG: hypothetical protein IPM59_13950 [Chloracidobacterium sp.]|nr:hypothetical protein [Chloracidobacterium sp.]
MIDGRTVSIRPPTNASRRAKGMRRVIVRAVICVAVCVAMVLAFYVSLIASAGPLTIDQKHTVRRAIAVLRDKGFAADIVLLENVTVFRADDNWLNATVAKENAFAATNFPFAIITLYSDFFAYPIDDVERAAILLHESRHLRGEDEHAAYRYVWLNRKQLGWTADKYAHSQVWDNIRRQTREHVPELFNCPQRRSTDCTE